MSAAREYKQRVLLATDRLSDDLLAELADFAEALCARKADRTEAGERELGPYEGRIRVLPEFFEPLPDDIQAAFEGRVE